LSKPNLSSGSVESIPLKRNPKLCLLLLTSLVFLPSFCGRLLLRLSVCLVDEDGLRKVMGNTRVCPTLPTSTLYISRFNYLIFCVSLRRLKSRCVDSTRVSLFPGFRSGALRADLEHLGLDSRGIFNAIGDILSE
jgi:hypothetical protein